MEDIKYYDPYAGYTKVLLPPTKTKLIIEQAIKGPAIISNNWYNLIIDSNATLEPCTIISSEDYLTVADVVVSGANAELDQSTVEYIAT